MQKIIDCAIAVCFFKKPNKIPLAEKQGRAAVSMQNSADVGRACKTAHFPIQMVCKGTLTDLSKNIVTNQVWERSQQRGGGHNEREYSEDVITGILLLKTSLLEENQDRAKHVCRKGPC